MADPVVARVEPTRDTPVQPLHARRQLPQSSVHNQVEVIRHDAVRVVRPPEPKGRAADPLVDVPKIEVVVSDPHPIDAASGDVVHPGRRQQVARAWHAHPTMPDAPPAAQPRGLCWSELGAETTQRVAPEPPNVGPHRLDGTCRAAPCPSDSHRDTAARAMSHGQSPGHVRARHVPRTVTGTRPREPCPTDSQWDMSAPDMSHGRSPGHGPRRHVVVTVPRTWLQRPGAHARASAADEQTRRYSVNSASVGA
jgi:hypothetical protein